MKTKSLFILLFLFLISASFAQAVAQKKKYSVLGENKDEIYGQFDKYEGLQEEPSGMPDAENFDDFLPKNAQEIAGRELLDYLENGLFSNMRYSRENWKRKDALSTDYGVIQKQQDEKRQLDALQQNERKTQQKVQEQQMKTSGGKQEKNW